MESAGDQTGKIPWQEQHEAQHRKEKRNRYVLSAVATHSTKTRVEVRASAPHVGVLLKTILWTMDLSGEHLLLKNVMLELELGRP